MRTLYLTAPDGSLVVVNWDHVAYYLPVQPNTGHDPATRSMVALSNGDPLMVRETPAQIDEQTNKLRLNQ